MMTTTCLILPMPLAVGPGVAGGWLWPGGAGGWLVQAARPATANVTASVAASVAASVKAAAAAGSRRRVTEREIAVGVHGRPAGRTSPPSGRLRFGFPTL